MCYLIFATPLCSCPPFPFPHTPRTPSYLFCHRAIVLAKAQPYVIAGVTKVLPKLCEERRVIYKDWGRECPGCARRKVDDVRVEREGRRRHQGVMEWDRGRAQAWERGGRESRDREVEESRRRWEFGGGGLRGRERWGDGY
jgi:hypothetical protein